MDLGLINKTAVIGASSQGLGKACALELAKEGANVVICGRRRDSLEATLSELQTCSKARAISVVADLSNSEGRQELLKRAQAEFGHIDILITNTGGPTAGDFSSHDMNAWEGSYRLLLESAAELIQGVLPNMKAKGWGRLIGITSQAVKQPMDGLILSNSLRAAVTALYKSLANEVGGFGITANTILPGFTLTDRLKSLNADLTEISKQIPVGRIASPHEFASVVTFIASERASFVNGAAIPVDGGWIRGLL